MATNEFEHRGRILAIHGQRATVSIEVSGGCASCAAQAKCGMSECADRDISIMLPDGIEFSVGQIVSIAISHKTGGIALYYSYILPLVVLLLTLVVGTYIGTNEGIVAAISLLLVALYYGILYLYRQKLEKKIKFTIKH